MKANELMIGDWVFLGDPAKVVGIRNDMDEPCVRTDATDTWYADGFEPILITQEILENNGYKDNGALMYIQYLMEKDGRCRVSIIEASGGYQVMVNSILCSPKAIHYVHELQHALRLCGIEKEIVL